MVFQLAGRRSNPFEVAKLAAGESRITQLVFIGKVRRIAHSKCCILRLVSGHRQRTVFIKHSIVRAGFSERFDCVATVCAQGVDKCKDVSTPILDPSSH